MCDRLVLVAQQISQFNRGLSIFQWGLTAVGIAVILLGMGLYLAKPRDPEKQTSPFVKWIVVIVSGLIGIGIIGYAWLGFSSL